MNDYFVCIGIKLAEKFYYVSGSTIDQPFATVKIATPVLNHICLSEEKVKLKLNQIKQKTGSPDKITSREMAEAAEALALEIVLVFFKNSIQSGVYPCSNWKTGEVVPLMN